LGGNVPISSLAMEERLLLNTPAGNDLSSLVLLTIRSAGIFEV
jgi:hypothetical protein